MALSRPTIVRLTLGFLLSSIVGLYFATQLYLNNYPELNPVRWRDAIAINMTYYYLWGVTTPLVFYLGRRFRLESKPLVRNLAFHIAASIVLTAVQILIAESLLHFMVAARPRSFDFALLRAFRGNFHSSLPTYWLILAIYYAVDYYGKFRDRELRASQLEARLSQAQLQALKMQLHPHFLFNTLNSISSLMYSDVDAADAMMSRLSEFLRLTLENSGQQEVTLREEIEFLDRYLAIERIRFDERLRVHIDVDPATLEARVPNLALQPLVENAIRHGIAARPEGGQIDIVARRENGNLHIGLKDDGPGVVAANDRSRREGIGLANTRARLQQLYGDDQRLELTNSISGGLLVTLIIPFRTAS
jgi:signal transduction histidine kinase